MDWKGGEREERKERKREKGIEGKKMLIRGTGD